MNGVNEVIMSEAKECSIPAPENPKCELKWPDVELGTWFYEKGEIQEQTADQILFKSDFDSTINWVPKKYIDKMLN